MENWKTMKKYGKKMENHGKLWKKTWKPEIFHGFSSVFQGFP